MSKLELGRVVVTQGISNEMNQSGEFAVFVSTSLGRYVNADWGDTCEVDAKANDIALISGKRILAVYKRKDKTIWIITEWDRSVTTILFPYEY